eukprot:gene10100-18997_t
MVNQFQGRVAKAATSPTSTRAVLRTIPATPNTPS